VDGPINQIIPEINSFTLSCITNGHPPVEHIQS
jgi:hypothetical protein